VPGGLPFFPIREVLDQDKLELYAEAHVEWIDCWGCRCWCRDCWLPGRAVVLGDYSVHPCDSLWACMLLFQDMVLLYEAL
jgi:hypothetical protein